MYSRIFYEGGYGDRLLLDHITTQVIDVWIFLDYLTERGTNFDKALLEHFDTTKNMLVVEICNVGGIVIEDGLDGL